MTQQSSLDDFVPTQDTRDETTVTLPESDPAILDRRRVSGLNVHVLDGQKVQGKVDLPAGAIGVVEAGIEQYIDSRKTGEREIAPSYSVWEQEFAVEEHGAADIPVVPGAVGEGREGGYIQLYYHATVVKAGVRLLSGGGRFSKSEFDFYKAVPFGVLRHDDSYLIISPYIEYRSEIDAEVSTEFTYRLTDDETPADIQMK